MDLAKKLEEKYKDVPLEDASQHYYGDGNVMSQLLTNMQDGIDQAGEIFLALENKPDPYHVSIYINQNNTSIQFSIDEFDEEEEEWANSRVFFTHQVGNIMTEALFVMQMMEDSGTSTGISQATNNWIEDLDFDVFGEFSSDYDISDWDEHIEY